jgi:hypothetical protein
MVCTLSLHVEKVWIFDNGGSRCWRMQTSGQWPPGTTINACDNLQASMLSSWPWKMAAPKVT